MAVVMCKLINNSMGLDIFLFKFVVLIYFCENYNVYWDLPTDAGFIFII